MPSTKLHTTTIEYTDSIHYKITITTDNKLRIKVPQALRKDPRSQEWIELCHSILEAVEKIDHPKTLRNKIYSTHNLPKTSFMLRSNSKAVFKVDLETFEIIKLGEHNE